MSQPLRPQQWVKIWVRVVDPYPDADNEIPVMIPSRYAADGDWANWPRAMVDVDMIVPPDDAAPTTDVVDGLVEVQLGEYAEKAANDGQQT